MGYYSEYNGGIDIDNAGIETLNPILDKFSQLIKDNTDGDIDIMQRENTVSISLWGEGRWYDWNTDLDRFAKELADMGYTVNGSVDRSGEDSGDLERWDCDDNKTATTPARIIYATDAEILDAIKEACADGAEAILDTLKSKNLY